MQTHNLIQGSPEWLAYRRDHFNASDAPAMMNASPYKTRAALLRELSTGVAPEVTDQQQYLFDRGHKFEGASRGMAESILGEELYPIVGSLDKLSASFDGLTMAEDIAWEHKTLNNELRACFRDMETMAPKFRERSAGKCLPLHHRIQMEQQLHVSGAEKVLFTASRWSDDGELLEAAHCWYYPNLKLRAEILNGWAQFEKDLAGYSPAAAAEVIVPAAVTALPGVSVKVSGEITIKDNFKTFELALREFIDKKLIRRPSTDQDFADLDLQIKALKGAEAALDAAEGQMVAQVKSIDDAKRIKDMLVKLARDNRLMAEKLLEARKTEIREEIVIGARQALQAHAAALSDECKPATLNLSGLDDFAGAIKGKRTVQTLREACDAELARARIALDNQARGIRANLAAFRDLAKDREVLFPDLGALAVKAADDFAAAVSKRIADADAAHQRLIQQQREAEERRQVEASIREAEKARIEEHNRQVELQRAQDETERRARAIAAATAAPGGAGSSPYAPLPAATPMAAPALAPVVAAPLANEPATLKLGTVCERLGFTMNAMFVEEMLGVAPAKTDRSAKLYRESDFGRICVALVAHINRATAHDWRAAA